MGKKTGQERGNSCPNIFMNYWKKRHFICYFWHINWRVFSLGLHVCTNSPNVEIHLPFGFVRIGWSDKMAHKIFGKAYGWGVRY